MARIFVSVCISLVLLAPLLFSKGAAQTSYSLGTAVPPNGSRIEVIASFQKFFCQFTTNSESERPESRRIRWFFNGEQITFSSLALYPGIVFGATWRNRVASLASNLTLLIINPTILHDGVIACYPPGNDTIGDNFALFRTILPSRTVSIRWHSSLVRVSEDQGRALVCAVAKGWTVEEMTLSVSVLTLNSTATVGEDFREFPNNLTFTEPSVCIAIEILEDGVHELDEYISLEMIPPTLPSSTTGEVNIVTSTAAKVVIVEDDEMMVELYVSSTQLTENSGSSDICVELNSDVDCPVGFPFVVILSIANALTPDISFPQEVRFNQCARINCIELLINDDDIAENEERLLISMEIENSSSNGLVPVANKQILTIIDDDVFPEMSTYTVAENNRSVEVCFRGRTASLLQPVKLTISTFNNGSATAGEDYVALSSLPLTLLRETARGCVEVTILPDDLLEETENFTIILDSLPAVSITIFIIDTTVCMTGELRLMDGATNHIGRLEVCYYGEWGAVCDDLFDKQAALVACRQLGFERKSIPIYSGFPNGALPILMDDVRCLGSEQKLIECLHKTREGSNCVASEAVGLICGDVCNDGEVKFSELDVNGNFYVKVCHDGEYYHMCGDKWDSLDAIVACREAGFYQYSIAFPESGYSIASERRITNTTCFGSESNFSSCDYNTSTTNGSCQWAAVKCNATTPCPRGTFWCPESGSGENTLCIPREAVCNGSSECQVTHADELVCTVVNFTQESYTVGEESEILNVCITVTLPESPLFAAKPSFSLVLQTLHDNIGEMNYEPLDKTLNFNSSNSTQCTSIVIVDNGLVATSRTGFILVIDSKEDRGLYIDRRYSTTSASVEIMDDEACNVNSQFLCESRLECLSLGLICDGVVDCNDTQTDEVNCIGFCKYEEVDGLSWPRTQAGHSVELVCPNNRNRSATRDCRHGQWVDTRICLTFAETLNITENNIESVLGQLKLLVSLTLKQEETEESALIVTEALISTANFLKSSDMSQQQMREVLNDIIGILDGLLQWDSEALGSQGSKNIQNFEAILVNIITSPTFTEELFITSDDIALSARPVTAELYVDKQLPFVVMSVDSKPNITESRQNSENQIATVTFPSSIFGSEEVAGALPEPLAISVVAYELPALFPPPSNRGGADTSVGTPVVSMIVANDGKQLEFASLDPPVEVTLSVTQVDNETFTNVKCVFWDFKRDVWSTKGCRTHYSPGEDYINCTCTHLTNFAALVDVCRRVEGCETSERADYILSILSIIGTCLSIMGLIVTIITMLFFRRLRKRDASKFHVQLCLAMLAMLLVFVTGVQQTEVKAGCVTVSLLIHYFTLVSVMWMGAEAILMFQKLVIVFGRVTKRHIVITSLICWLAPIIPVIIPVAINPNYVIFEPDDNNEGGFCFISNTAAFFAAFLAPIMIVILFNYVVFVIIVLVLIRHKHRHKMTGMRTAREKERKSTVRLMISISGIMSLYGLTWIFGALTIDRASLAFQVLFVLFNSLQGFFIFLFFCVLGRDGRELWLEILFCGRYKSTHLHPTSVGTGSTVRKASNHLLTLSDNTSSTLAPVLEKTISSMSTGGTFVISFVESSEKSKGGDQSLSDAEERLTPEPTVNSFKGEKLSDTQTYQNTEGNGLSIVKESSEEPINEVSNDTESVTETDTATDQRDDEDVDSLEELKDVIHYVETTFENALSVAHI